MHNKIGYICLSGIRGWSSLGDAKRTSSRARHLVRHAQEDTHISTRDIREGSAALQHMESFSEHQRCKKDRLVPETHAGAPALPCRTHKELNTILQPTSKRTYLRSLGKERSFQSGLVAGYPVELRCIDVFQEQKVQQKKSDFKASRGSNATLLESICVSRVSHCLPVSTRAGVNLLWWTKATCIVPMI
jgi:hypothetical protein